jgi:DNA polymerase-3 subunit alpha
MAGYTPRRRRFAAPRNGQEGQGEDGQGTGEIPRRCAKLHNIKPDVADEVFDTLEKFAGYGFNRSHSAAYAWVSYQTAYLKANYPVEFMAAVMSNEVSNTDKISIFVAECERLGIKILPPDLNLAGLKFEPAEVNSEGVEALKVSRRTVIEAGVEAAAEDEVEEAGVRFEDLPAERSAKRKKRVKTATKEALAAAAAEKLHLGAIRYGLAAIKNVGEPAMEAAIAERTNGGAYTSLEDFCSRVDSRKISKKAVECLVKCGAFDFTGVERAQLFSEIDGAMAAAASAHRTRPQDKQRSSTYSRLRPRRQRVPLRKSLRGRSQRSSATKRSCSVFM